MIFVESPDGRKETVRTPFFPLALRTSTSASCYIENHLPPLYLAVVVGVHVLLRIRKIFVATFDVLSVPNYTRGTGVNKLSHGTASLRKYFQSFTFGKL